MANVARVQVHCPFLWNQLYKETSPSHSNTPQALSQVLLLRRPLISPSVAFCIPIASIARTVMIRAGLRNLCMLKILLGIAVNQVFRVLWGQFSVQMCALAPFVGMPAVSMSKSTV